MTCLSVPSVTLTEPPALPPAPDSGLAIGDQMTDPTSLALPVSACSHNSVRPDLAETEKQTASPEPPLAGCAPPSCSSTGVVGVGAGDWSW
jgi:hypothetical protein